MKKWGTRLVTLAEGGACLSLDPGSLLRMVAKGWGHITATPQVTVPLSERIPEASGPNGRP